MCYNIVLKELIMTISRHKIVVEIVVETLDDRPTDVQMIAMQYAEMAKKYASIGAVESRVVTIERD
jgi:hypothetical protein